MQPDTPALLWDAHRASLLVTDFLTGRSWEDYRADLMLRSAVERRLQILGEALNRVSHVDAESAELIPDLRRIVAFRNVLVHGYAVVDDAIVWDVASTRMEPLMEVLNRLLGQTTL